MVATKNQTNGRGAYSFPKIGPYKCRVCGNHPVVLGVDQGGTLWGCCTECQSWTNVLTLRAHASCGQAESGQGRRLREGGSTSPSPDRLVVST